MVGLKLALLLIVPILFWVLPTYLKAKRLKTFAAGHNRLSARISGKRLTSDRGQKKYLFKVNYQVGQSDYEVWVPAQADEFKQLTEGQTIDLVYLPQDPEKPLRSYEVDPEYVRRMWIKTALLALAWTALYLFLAYMKR